VRLGDACAILELGDPQLDLTARERLLRMPPGDAIDSVPDGDQDEDERDQEEQGAPDRARRPPSARAGGAGVGREAGGVGAGVLIRSS